MMAAGRVINIAIGVAMVPLLIHFVRGEGFAVWTILLSCAAAFSAFDLGLRTALVKHLAVAPDRRQESGGGRIVSTTIVIIGSVFCCAAPAVALVSARLAAWLGLPNVGALTAGTAILVTYGAVFARSVLLLGHAVLWARRRFVAVAILSCAQALASNIAATAVAGLWRRLDAVVFAYWIAQITVCACGAVIAIRQLLADSGFSGFSMGLAGKLLQYGLRVQVHEWAQTINFQFDKFVILKAVGLRGVGLYEVANRSILALRSVPASGLETLLPSAAAEAAKGDSRAWYARATRLAGFAVGFLVLAPWAIAPVFLYAWIGEMGYVTRWTFGMLAVGCGASLLAVPAGTLLQAHDRPGTQARAALVSIALNIPLSLAFVRVWGVEGAALGTTMAMVIGSLWLLRDAHGLVKLSPVTTWRQLQQQQWPMWIACATFGIVTHQAFGWWFLNADPTVRYALPYRVGALVLSGLLYAACVGLMLVAKVLLVGLAEDERSQVARWRGMARTWRQWALAQ
jgi:O-antigen/teichoic acid export membrane protein